MKNSYSLLRYCVIALLGYWVIGLTACGRREIKNINSFGTNIICFGDSITLGYGANPAEDYPARLGQMLKLPVINAGIDGDTTSEALRRLDSDVLERNPLLVIIEFGGNDFLRKVPIQITLKNMKEMIEKIQTKGAMVAVVDISSGMFLKDYAKGFAQLAKEKEAIFIPGVLAGIITNPALKSDFIHPNAAGYQLIAQRIYRAILPYLNQNSLKKKFSRESY
ncbi:MAG: arylesterase [Candidatus Omnitrophica bacterium]|nr:arylesterase [Candidatus Omnitrophota bacterium]